MWHSCGRYSLEALFAGSEPHVFPLFRKFERMVRACGPVRRIPQKTRIVFQARIRFAGCVPRKSYLLGSFLLSRKLKHPRFVKIETYYPRLHGHQFKIASSADLDKDVARWLREAYAVGEQKHLK